MTVRLCCQGYCDGRDLVDMLKYMHMVMRQGGGLNKDEYQLLALAFKTIIHMRRESYQSICLAEYKECRNKEQVSIGIFGHTIFMRNCKFSEVLHGNTKLLLQEKSETSARHFCEPLTNIYCTRSRI